MTKRAKDLARMRGGMINMAVSPENLQALEDIAASIGDRYGIVITRSQALTYLVHFYRTNKKELE